ncbi:trypsin-like peptidase domain-containing protein [Deinococcus sp.]|uniref:S1C family serine protease n=1 Tax=Deinococcus sp. TaxID=47478 RepID=UPI0025D6F114|nr:trypsin-like peptidase domain-containing protein [Deinococcus sp.]
MTTTFHDLSAAMADAVAQTSQSIVSVLAGRRISGVVTGEREILSVAHVLHGDEVKILTQDGRELMAQVVGRDPATDLALLRAEGLKLPAVSASQGASVGELLLVVGRPGGVQAALGFLGAVMPERGFAPTGATPFRGVSGGGVFDARGGLVGVANAGLSRGELLAVPAARALNVAALLARDGRVPRGYLGIGTQPVHFPGQADQPENPSGSGAQAGVAEDGPGRRGPGSEGRERGGRGRGERGGRGRQGWADWTGGGWNQAGPRGGGPRGGGPGRGGPGGGRIGLTIVQIEAGSPAQAAGLMLGDVLLLLGADGIHHPNQLLEAVRDRSGETLTLRILRGGSEQDVQVTLGER